MLRLGTDCSGLDAPAFALKQMGVPFEHVFSSEIDKPCLKTILANHSPNILYGDESEGDVTKRDVASTPACDLYVCGFPCQPFSVAGRRKGMQDERGNVFPACVSYIRHHRPKHFVLENVVNLLHLEGGRVMQLLIRELESIPNYTVSFSVMNTRDYGVPQSRRRLYIVGMRGEDMAFQFPDPVPCPTTFLFVDYEDTTKTHSSRAEECKAISKEIRRRGLPGCFFDQLHMQRSKEDKILKGGYPVSPCITCNSYHWNVEMNRRASVKELLWLQGLPGDLKVVVSDTSIRRQIGNCMSCNVLKAIFERLLSPQSPSIPL